MHCPLFTTFTQYFNNCAKSYEIIHNINIHYQTIKSKCNLKIVWCMLSVFVTPLNLPGRHVISMVSYPQVELEGNLQISVYVYE